MRLIDADALMRYCSNTKSKTISNNDIARFPTIEERKKGRWLNKGRKICCSECGRINFCKPNFCDECGADMREEKTDAEIH